MMENHEMWSRLPVEILERVLSLLPVPDLCRCCAVCKRWNSLISTPQFGSLCVQSHAKEGQSYIVARWVAELDFDAEPNSPLEVEPESNKPIGYLGWSILDLETKRWHRAFNHEFVKSFEFFSIEGFMAAEGGLVCEYMEDLCSLPSVRISNPLKNKGIRVLPAPPIHPTSYPRDALMNFVVDNVEKSFKVFFIYTGFRSMDYDQIDPQAAIKNAVMYIYDSITELWQSTTNPPLQRQIGIGYLRSAVIFPRPSVCFV